MHILSGINGAMNSTKGERSGQCCTLAVSTIEKKCLAIRWAVLTRHYLLGQEFALCLDHAPLQWLHCMNDTNMQITHWYLALQPVKFRGEVRVGLQARRLPGLRQAVGVCHGRGRYRMVHTKGERVRK